MRKFRKWFQNFCFRNVYNITTSEDLLRMEGEKIMFGSREISKDEFNRLKSDAVHISSTLLWKVMQSAVYADASERMYFRGKTDEDLLGGKMELHTLSVLQDTVEQLKNK